MSERAREFLRIAAATRHIVESDASWELKYRLVFSREVSRAAEATGLMPAYADPDTTAEEDVLAFFAAIRERAEELERIYARPADKAPATPGDTE